MRRTTVTYAQGGERGLFDRIYDRLRKRSQRDLGITCLFASGLSERGHTSAHAEHQGYIHGVKDALNSVFEVQR